MEGKLLREGSQLTVWIKVLPQPRVVLLSVRKITPVPTHQVSLQLEQFLVTKEANLLVCNFILNQLKEIWMTLISLKMEDDLNFHVPEVLL